MDVVAYMPTCPGCGYETEIIAESRSARGWRVLQASCDCLPSQLEALEAVQAALRHEAGVEEDLALGVD